MRVLVPSPERGYSDVQELIHQLASIKAPIGQNTPCCM